MSLPAAPATSDERLHALDGLRGLAALAVFFFHAFPLLPLSDGARAWLDATPIGNGPGAVHVFFVLSGYVLTITLGRDDAPGRLARFYVRRVFRIHPPYMAAVLLAWTASRLLPGVTGDPGLQWPMVEASRLPIALAFPSMAFGLLPVGWSLFVELAMSMVFPLLLLIGRHIHGLAAVAIAALYLVTDLGPQRFFLHFAIDFALGMFLRLEQERVGRTFAALPRVTPMLACIAGLALLQAPLLAEGEGLHTSWSIAVFASSAALVVVGALHWPAFGRLLETPPARWVGRISYSLFLVHHTVLWAVVFRFGRQESLAPAIGAMLLILAGSFVLAELGWRFVEQPSIRAGRALIQSSEGFFARTQSG